MPPHEKLPYRPCAGMMVLNPAGLVFVGSRLALGISAFAAVNFALTLAWLWIVIRIAREHRALTGEESGERPVTAKSA